MQKNYFALAFIGAFSLFIVHDATTNLNGAPAGNNGSPNSSGTCAQLGCHSGGPSQSTETVTISTTIPAAGFSENTAYDITVDADDGGRNLNRIGFQASVETGNGHQGVISSTSGRTQKLGSFITHTFNGTNAPGGQNSWTFEWNSGTAPDQSEVYAAVNFTNSNGANSGDVIVTESLTLNKESGISVKQPELVRFSIYPNPAKDFITLASEQALEGVLRITDLQGQLVKVVPDEAQQDAHHWRIDVSNLARGVYLIKSAHSKSALFQKQ